jgi:hypothetical protein
MIILEQGEEILVVAKKHWITYVGLTITHIIVFFLVLVGAFIFYSEIAREVIASFLWLIASSFVWLFITQYLDTWCVTINRIVAVDQIELFDRSESSVLMSRVQDVQFKRTGILQEFLGYGTLTVQSAGEEREFVIHDVANVESVAQLIIDQKTKVVQPKFVNQEPV